MKQKTPLLAIRSYCKGCMCSTYEEVEYCPVTACDLFPFRMGKNPYRTYSLSEEAKALRHEQGLKLAELNKLKRAAQVLRPPEQQD